MIRRKHAFTLLELLTTMAILSILAGLIFVAVTFSRTDARIRRAESEVAALSDAWKQYFITYGQWPEGFAGQQRAMSSDVMRHILGDNPHGIRFMELPRRFRVSDPYLDPWGKAYSMRFDAGVTEGEDRYKTSVQFINSQRYAYED